VTAFGKPDRTGRSSGILERSERKLLAPPPGGFIWLTRGLLASEAWRGQSRNCLRFISTLMLDHVEHAGRENGRLQATFAELVAGGLSRRKISAAIAEAVERGLVTIERRGGLYGVGVHRTPSLFRLTWIGCIKPARPATNEWRYFEKIISPVPHGGTTLVPPRVELEATGASHKWLTSSVSPGWNSIYISDRRGRELVHSLSRRFLPCDIDNATSGAPCGLRCLIAWWLFPSSSRDCRDTIARSLAFSST
jgi:hypothetical protein